MVRNFRDMLALLIAVLVFPALWVLHGCGIVCIPEGIIGATIAIETLIAQFYFRKRSGEETETKPPS